MRFDAVLPSLLLVSLPRLVNLIGHLRSLHKCYGYKPAQNHHDECSGHDSTKKPTSLGTIDIPKVAARSEHSNKSKCDVMGQLHHLALNIT